MAVALLPAGAAAQVKFGDFSTHLSGTIAPGYSADYSNMGPSDHSWVLAGTGNFTGSYYNPNFLTFAATYYLNQSRANSDFQSISNASGVDLTTSIFGGSHFPGAVNYSKTYNSEGNYAVPGLADYVTHGNSDTFAVNWSENLPKTPTFSAGYQMGTSNYSVYGTNDQGSNNFRSLNLHSGYQLDGFNLGAYYTTGDSNSQIPELLGSLSEAETHSTTDAVGFNVAHSLPLQGSASAGFNRSSWDTNFIGTTSSGTIDMINGSAAVHPTQKTLLTGTVTYSDNLTGQLLQSIVAAGGVVAGAANDQTSNSLDILGVATYSPSVNLQLSALGELRNQTYLGENYGVASAGGSVTYLRDLLDGTFNGSFSLTENLNDQNSNSSLGFSANGSYSKLVLGWHLNGSLNYAQNAETLLVTYMNSYYNYSGNARRAWGNFNLSMGAGGSRTALTQIAGTTSQSDSYNASMGYGRWITATGSYAHASGQAVATGAGLTPVPIPTPVLPASLISLYGGTSYSGGLSSSPIRRLSLAAAYARSNSDIASQGISSSNQTQQFNSLIQYQVRKLYYTSGYARLEQGFSTSGLQPQIVSSYYVGISRWFNFF